MLISEISVPEALRKSRPAPAHEGLPDSLAHTLKVSDWPAVTAKVPERFTPPWAVPTRAALVPECASATMLTGPLVDQPERSLSKPLLPTRPQVCATAGEAAARQMRAAKEIHFFVSMGTSLLQRPAAAAEDTRWCQAGKVGTTAFRRGLDIRSPCLTPPGLASAELRHFLLEV